MAAPKDTPPVMLTTEQLAERWEITPAHLEVKRMRGTGPAFVKLGDDSRSPVRYRLEDVEAYEDERRKRKTGRSRADKP